MKRYEIQYRDHSSWTNYYYWRDCMIQGMAFDLAYAGQLPWTHRLLDIWPK